MNVVPFCGMKIEMVPIDFHDHQERREPNSSPTLHPAYNVILDRLQWKYFAVSFHGDWMRSIKWNCQAVLLAKKILEDFSEVLEGLKLDPPCMRRDLLGDSIEPLLKSCTFPCLQSLRFRKFSSHFNEAQNTFIRTVVARAPNLQELYLKGPIDFGVNLLEGSSAVLLVDSLTDPVNDEIREDLLVGLLRLKQMKLKYVRNFSMERFDRIVPQVLQTSLLALKSLYLNLAFVVKLMCYGISLENVTDLRISMSHRQLAFFRLRMLKLLKDFDFTHTFPSLNKVAVYPSKVNFSHSALRQIVEQGHATWKEPPSDRAVNIKLLGFSHLPAVPPFFASMFPNTEILKVKLLKGPTFPYELIWEHWVDLKEFHIRIEKSFLERVRHEDEQSELCENVDSFVCGLHPEEVAELREKDEEYLKTVNIVPIMPSVTCMKALKTLRFILRGSGCFSGKHDPTFIFSKVTGLVAFSRCSNLSVTIDTLIEWEHAFCHLENYASFVYR